MLNQVALPRIGRPANGGAVGVAVVLCTAEVPWLKWVAVVSMAA